MPFEEVGLRARIDGLSGYLSGVDQIERKTSRLSGVLKTAIGTALGFGGAQLVMGGVSKVFGMVGGSVIGMNAELETSTLQFETLFKDADRAKKHVKSLFDFAAKTPFETGPIIQASRIMQTFGGDALNTEENLRRVGDAAAVANIPINEVGFWVGRAYSAIKNGQPFGEAAMRLQEMAVLSGEARLKMEKLQKSGADSAEIWSVFEGVLDSNKGAMEKQAGTFAGLTSTISDNIRLASATAFKPLFDLIKGLLGAITSLVSSKAFSQFAEGAASSMKAVIGAFKSLFSGAKKTGSGMRAVSKEIRGLIQQLLTVSKVGAKSLLPSLKSVGKELSKVFSPRNRQAVFALVTALVSLSRSVLGQVLKDIFKTFKMLLDEVILPLSRYVAPLVTSILGLGEGFSKSADKMELARKILVGILEAWLALKAISWVITFTQNIVQTGATLITQAANITQTITQNIKRVGAFFYDVKQIAAVWTQVITQEIKRLGELIEKGVGKGADFIQTITQKVAGPTKKDGQISGESFGKGYSSGLLGVLGKVLGGFTVGIIAASLGGSLVAGIGVGFIAGLAAVGFGALIAGAILLGTEKLGLSLIETIASGITGSLVLRSFLPIFIGPLGFLASFVAGEFVYRFRDTILKTLAEVAGSIAGGIAALFYYGIPFAAEALFGFSETVRKFFQETIPNLIIEQGPGVLVAIGKWLFGIEEDVRKFFQVTLPDVFFKFLTVSLPNEASRGFPVFRNAFFTALKAVFFDLPKWWYTSVIPATFTFFTSTLPTAVVKFLTSTVPTLATKAYDLGKAIVDGIVKGVGDLFTTLKKPFEEGFNKAVDFVKGLLGIKSPSTVYKGIGEDIVQGLINGVSGMADALVKALEKLVSDAVGKVPGAELVIKGIGVAGGLKKKLFGGQQGIWRVPGPWNVDSFPTRLAGGEMVVPARLAERLRDTISYPHSTNQISSRQDSFTASISVESEDRISAAIRRELKGFLFSSGFAR